MKRDGFARRRNALVRRRWTASERAIVWRGLTGRFALAIEPLIGMLFMALLTWGIVYRARHVASDATLIKIAWIFALGAFAFAGYFVAVLLAPIVAYVQTFRPIYIVDGYVRYREPDERSRIDACGYAAALFADRTVACEWEWLRQAALTGRDDSRARRVFGYAGIHKIDGKPTGLLPDDQLPLLCDRHRYAPWPQRRPLNVPSMVTVERAARGDLDTLLPLVGAYRTFYKQVPDLRREREFLRRRLENGTSTIYLARDERGEAVGFVQIFQAYSTVRLGPSLILEDLFVVPTARKMGVARRLLQRASELARDVGAVNMFLENRNGQRRRASRLRARGLDARGSFP